MRGAGFLAIWSDVDRTNLTDYRHWLTREHTTERVTTDGFLACRVFRAARADIERFFILYELETPEVRERARRCLTWVEGSPSATLASALRVASSASMR